MQSILEILRTEHKTEHDFILIKKQYTSPKIFHGGESFDLKKRWYVYYSYRNPYTFELKRQPNIYMAVNSNFHTVKDRMRQLKVIQKNVTQLLKSGFSPYLHPETKEKYTAKSALLWALEIKQRTLSEKSSSDYNSRINQFIKYCTREGLDFLPIDEFKRKYVLEYLNEVLKSSAPKTRNNHRTVLSSIFGILKENEMIRENIVETISVEKTKSVRHKSYSPTQVDALLNLIEKKDKDLFLFVRMVAYNFLRPVEVVRLRYKDLNLGEKQPYLEVKAKNKLEKIKIIPSILLPDLQKLDKLSPNDFLFQTNNQNIESSEVSRRTFFGKEFLKIKKELKLGPEYTMYSFRHTFITKLYRELRKESTVLETYDRLMLITGHSTLKALKSYLRDLDADLPEDYSHLL